MLADILGFSEAWILQTLISHFFSAGVKNRGILVISSDKGLAEPQFLTSSDTNQTRGDCKFVGLGKRAQFVSRTKRELLADFPLSDNARFSEVHACGRISTQGIHR